MGERFFCVFTFYNRTHSRRGTVQQEVRDHVEPGSKAYTDALPSYNGLNSAYVHEAINHAECYVRGAVPASIVTTRAGGAGSGRFLTPTGNDELGEKPHIAEVMTQYPKKSVF